MSDCVALVREFPRRWKILSVCSDQLGDWDIRNHNLRLVLADLQANLFSKVTETGFLFLMVMSVRYSSAWSSAKSRSSYAENNVYRMPLVWSSVVRCSTQTIAMLKKSADITHPYLTPIVILKLSVLTSVRGVVVNALIEKK